MIDPGVHERLADRIVLIAETIDAMATGKTFTTHEAIEVGLIDRTFSKSEGSRA